MIKFKMDRAMKLKIKKGLKKWIKNNPQKHKQYQQKRTQRSKEFFKKNPQIKSFQYYSRMGKLGVLKVGQKELAKRRQKGTVKARYIKKLMREYRQQHPFQFQPYHNKFQLRKMVLKLYDYKCLSCGFYIDTEDQKIKGMPLDVHHVDGNNKNNDFNNLVILCKNCHSLTKNYRFNYRKHKNPLLCANNKYTMTDPIVPVTPEVL